MCNIPTKINENIHYNLLHAAIKVYAKFITSIEAELLVNISVCKRLTQKL